MAINYPDSLGGGAPIDMQKGADGTWYAKPAGETWARDTNARVGGNAGYSGSLAGGAMVVGGQAVRTFVPAGCSPNEVNKRVNDLLNWGYGAVKYAMIGGAYLADPLAGVGVQLGIQAYQQATGTGCAATVPSPPATAAQVGAVGIAVSTGFAGVPVGGGLTGEQAASLYHIGMMLSGMEAQYMHWSVFNPKFLIRIGDDFNYSGTAITGGASVDRNEFLALEVATLASRLNSDADTLSWLRRVVPTFTWAADADGYVIGTVQLADPEVLPAMAVWPWDAWGVLYGESAPWMKDFAKYYKWEVSPGVEWSVLGFLKDAFAGGGYRSTAVDPPPLTS